LRPTRAIPAKRILVPIHTVAEYRVRPAGVEKVKRAIEDFVPYVKSNEPGTRIREWARIILLVGVVTVLSSIVLAQGASTRLQPLPRTFEVKLALSAAPPHLRANATVYVLDPGKGYVLERKGTNGFTCYVERTDYLREDFGDGFITPECQDAEGSRTIVPVEFDIERLRAEGKLSPAELKREIERRFKSGAYKAPSRPGVVYMLSPVARLYGGPGSKETMVMNMPHFMFFAPNLTEKDFGGGPIMGPYPYLINQGPMGYMILNVGETEKGQINRASQDLIKEACKTRADLCLAGVAGK
jgi:hypothetical protein